MKLELVRHAYLPRATLGILIADGLRLATIEEAWKPDPDGPGGQKREGALVESCVPDGIYRLEPHTGTKQKNVWALVNHELGVYHWPADMPTGQKFGRFGVLIHVANDTLGIEGCIGLGLRHDVDRSYVYESGAAIEQLRKILGTTAVHELTIRPLAGTSEIKLPGGITP